MQAKFPRWCKSPSGGSRRAMNRSDHGLDADHVGVAALAAGVAAGHDHGVTRFEVQHALGRAQGVIIEDLHARELLGQHRQHAPGHGQLVPRPLVGGEAEDVGRRAEARDHAHGQAAQRGDHDGLRVEVDGHGAGRVGDRVDAVVDLKGPGLEQALVVDVPLGLLGDLAHDAHGVHRVPARGGLAREHDGAGPVVDGVGHVADLGAGGAGVGDHALEHLGCGDDALAAHAADGDQMLLDGGQLGKRHLHAEVAAGHHDALAGGADLVDVVHAGLVLDLGDDVDVPAAVVLQEGLEVDQVLLAGDEGGGHEVHAVADAEEQVGPVLLGHVGLTHDLAGEAHALAVGEHAAREHGAADLGVLDGADLEDHEAVVDEDFVARREVVGQPSVADGDDALVPDHVLAGGEGEVRPVPQRDLPAAEGADAVLGALGVEHDGDGEIELLPHGLDHVDLLLVFLMGAVGEVEARHVQARQTHGPEDGGVLARGADGADDLGLAHGISSFMFSP